MRLTGRRPSSAILRDVSESQTQRVELRKDMPPEERYVLGKRGRVLEASQPNTQRIAHCRFETFAGLGFRQRRLVDQIHRIVDENACFSGKVVARWSGGVISYERTDRWVSQHYHVR